VSDEETTPILVCVPVRVLSSPEPGSVKSVCQTCETPVWVSKHGMSFIKHNPTIYIACNNCAIEIIGAEEFDTTGYMIPGAPEWMNVALEAIRRDTRVSDIMRVRDLGDE